MRRDYRISGRGEDTWSGSACLTENVSYDCIFDVWDLCTHAGSASGLEPVLYAITNYSGLSDIQFSPSIVLTDCVVKMRSGIRFIYEGNEEDSRLRPTPQNAARLLASLCHHFEPQSSVSPGHSINISYTYLLSRICLCALDVSFITAYTEYWP